MMNATYTIEITDAGAEKLLKNLEEMKLIKFISKNTGASKISERLRGKISPKVAEDLDRQTKQMRKEW